MVVTLVRRSVCSGMLLRKRRISTQNSMLDFFQQLADGRVTPAAAVEQVKALGGDFTAINSFAKIDYAREARTGFPEVIYGESKTPEQVSEILESMYQRSQGEDRGVILASRISPSKHQAVRDILRQRDPKHHVLASLQYFEQARLQVIDRSPQGEPKLGTVAVLSAGTADLPVAEEAAVVASLCGAKVERVYDVGVAGIHRLFNKLHIPRRAHVVICVAGMDGALPTVVGGLVEAPVIAVPTSIGYGVSTGGLAALGTMLSGCAPGLSVVNIDNGLGAAAMALKILRTSLRRQKEAE